MAELAQHASSDDVLIIGGGIIGLSIGWRLVRQGLSVTILERDVPGSGATTAAAGMLAPVSEAQFEERALVELGCESLEMWPDFAADLQADSGIDVGYRTDGMLVLALDRDDQEALEHLHRYHEALGLEARLIGGDEAREMEPGLSPNVSGAVFCPGDHQVEPRRVMRALVQAFEAAGGTIRRNCEVRRIELEDERVRGVTLANATSLHARQVVVAAGAWSRAIDGLGPDRPQVRPVRGQMLAVELGEPPLCRHAIQAPDAYLVPKDDGRLVVGATMEERGFDPRLTAGGIMDLLRGAWEALPAIYDAALLETWTGFRPVSLDNQPIMEKAQLRGLFIATGHGRNGILLAPLTAHRMAGMILAEQ